MNNKAMEERSIIGKGLLGTVSGFGSLALANTVHHWLGIVVMLAGLIVSILSAWSIWRARKKADVEMAHEMARLCADCVDGKKPPLCPLSAELRPENCPLMRLARAGARHRGSEMETGGTKGNEACETK